MLAKDYLGMARDIIRRLNVQDINKAVDLLYAIWQNGGSVFACGNGGSASTAQHFVCDLVKSAHMKALCLNDNIPLVSALTNDDGFDSIFVEQLRGRFGLGDLLVCISVHGGVGQDKAGLWSQNLLRAVDYVRHNQGHVLGLSGFDGGELAKVSDVCITVKVNSTPIVESLHSLICHILCECLKERIEND